MLRSRPFAVLCLLSALAASRGEAQITKIHGIDFGPYMDGQSPLFRTPISAQQIDQRLTIVAPYTNWVRTFGSTDGLEATCGIAHAKGLDCAMGAWIGRDAAANTQQIDSLISTIANAAPGVVDIAIVGSEVLLRTDQTAAQMVAYINQVKQALAQANRANVKVATAEVWSKFVENPSVIQAVDIVMPNYYPYWNGVSIDSATCTLKLWHEELAALAGGKEIIVSETGWPTAGNTIGGAVPSLANSVRYAREFVSWARTNNVKYFYFVAFDETWKATPQNPQEAHWGIWDKDGVMKPGMDAVFNGVDVPVNCPACGAGGVDIRFTYVPPRGSFLDLRGEVQGVAPASHRTALYILVNGLWYVKPFVLPNPSVAISSNCQWTADITTGGNDQDATQIYAFLIPSSYSPPNVSNAASLPQELFNNALDSVTITRTATPISGSVTDSGGNGVSGVDVQLTGSSAQSAKTAPGGAYSFANVAPGGSYTVAPASPDFTFTPPSSSFSNIAAPQVANFVASSVPAAPSNISPLNGATGVPIPVTLSWTSAAGASAYEVYFGTGASPPLVTSIGTTSYSPGGLSANTAYHWRIVAKNLAGGTTGPTWSFTTAASVPPLGPLLFKEDFEVSSDYAYVAPGPNVLVPEGVYTIATNPQANHGSFSAFGDHTSGSGRMLIANGRSVVNSVWSRKISGLNASQQYRLRLFGASAYPSSPARLEFRVNGSPVAPNLLLPQTTGAWTELSVLFSAPGTEITVALVDLTTAPGGNDFAVDDIELIHVASSTSAFKEDFEVSSDYAYVAPGPSVLVPEGRYTIDTNPRNNHSSFHSFGDRTTGSGRMLIANGRSTVDSVWARVFAGLVPGQTYQLRLQAATAYPLGPAQLQFRVNGSPLTPTLVLPLTTGAWTELLASFTAPASSVHVGIVDLSTAAAGNDFAIDDIELHGPPGTPLVDTVLKEDFEVSSDYAYVAPSSNSALHPAGTYTIAPNPVQVHNLFCSFGDRTTGSGRMLIANGRSAPESVWSRTISGLTAGQQYRLSLWAASAYPQGAAQLQFLAGGAAQAPTLTAPLYGNVCPAAGSPSIWQKLEVIFTAAASQVSVELRDLSTVAIGNDFAVDDIELASVSTGAIVFREDFEVRSDYSYVAPTANSLVPEGNYTIGRDPRAVHGSFCSFGDHTTGSGRMLIANGRSVVNSVWARSVSGLAAGQQYRLSLWAASAYPQGAALLQFSVNGAVLSPTLTAPLYGGSCPASGSPSIWQKLEVTFTATGAQAAIELKDLSTVAAGNDFAIDDIELVRVN